MTRHVRLITALVLAVVCAAGLSACGERSEDGSNADRPPADRLSLLLDYLPNVDHAGIYAAQQRGQFERAGLDVDVRAPQDPASVLKLVEAGKVDVGITYEPELLLARQKNKDLVAFASVIQKPLTSLVSLPKANIRSPKDLANKTVGTSGIAYQDSYLDTILKRAGVDPSSVKRVNVGFNLNQALIFGRVDATLGAFSNVEAVDLERRGRKPVVTPVDRLGVPTYDELVLVAKDETLTKRESAIRRLVRAIALGTAQVKRDPQVGVDALLRVNRGLDRRLTAAQLQRTIPAFFPTDGKPWGWMDTDEWATYAQWMLDNRLLSGRMPLDNVLTTDFLQGEGTGEGRKTPGGAERPSQRLDGFNGE